MTKFNKKQCLKWLKIVSLVVGIGLSSTGSTQAGRDSLNDDFKAAFIVTWLATLFNLMMFPAYLVIHKLAKLEPRNYEPFKDHIKMLYTCQKNNKFSWSRFLSVSLGFSFMWMVANYSFIKALDFILPSDNTAIYSSSNIFVFILSVLILKEKFYITKCLSVIIATTGVILIAFADGFNQSRMVGIFLSLTSAISASFYKVLYKKLIKFGSVAQVSFTMTIIGIFDAILYWPFIAIMHFTGFEVIPSDNNLFPYLPIFGRGSFALIFNFLVNFGIAYVSAVVISIGSLLALPFNTLFDFIFRNPEFNWIKLVGSLLIVVSFIILLIPDILLAKFEFKVFRYRSNLSSKSLANDPKLNYMDENPQFGLQDDIEINSLDIKHSATNQSRNNGQVD